MQEKPSTSMNFGENDRSGFFKGRHIEFRSRLAEEDLNKFGSLKDDESRFEFVRRHGFTLEEPFKKIPTQVKNEEAATLIKQDANKAFQSQQYSIALQMYNKSLMKAPGTSEEAAIIRANRSAALYNMGEYVLALEDINTAISTGYPKHLLHKVEDRKARCCLALKRHQSALQAFQRTLTALDDARLSTEQRQKWQRDVQIMIAMLNKNQAKDEEVKKTAEDGSDTLENSNPIFKAASVAVSFKYSNQLGRYTEAARSIKPGEIVLKERAHCAVLLDQYAATNCFHCFKRWTCVEPCPRCSAVGFCSVGCRDKALGSHHGIECAILASLWSSGTSITCHIAFRMIAQKPCSYFANTKLKENFKAFDGKAYNGSDYTNVYNLVRHQDQRSVEDFLHRAHVAVFLFSCLEEAGYFNNFGGSQEDLIKTEKLVGGLLLRNLQLVQFNAHEVSQLEMKSAECLDGVKSVFIGGAVYPTLALFNHSCDPSIVRYFNGTTVVARAVKPIRRGETIGENYGPIFTETRREDRQTLLKNQYWFECGCAPCTENWPTIEDMDPTVLRFRCQQVESCRNVILVPTDTMEFAVMCDLCDKFTNILKGLKVLQDTETLFRLGKSLKEEGKIGQALKKFLELLSLLDETLAPPFRDYHMCQQEIRTCFLSLGNKYVTTGKKK